ncbi:zinc finger domain-containing protein [Mimivirus argentum]|uniref:Zinc finger C2H2-type domain-containing protein n=1 Tax=Mimivirus sp. 'lentille' TaxID=1128146 RepID=H6WBD8_9VIRU|nr:zinc finger C2H2-type domain-containing protein [Mimivirus lentille]AEY99258.1 zinc finger C2H2-type domain-containing protein [Acanthamoeba castellanii mamavirus]UMZ08538.1 zinc finger domain-containing protein [Mimivirus argentum]
MSDAFYKEKIKNQYFDMHKNFCNLIIKQNQKEYDNKHFKEKTPSDKIKCLVCNKYYKRNAKSKHEKTKTHQRNLEIIYEFILANFLDSE